MQLLRYVADLHSLFCTAIAVLLTFFRLTVEERDLKCPVDHK